MCCMVKKSGLSLFKSTAQRIMLPQFYHRCLNNYLSESQQLTLEILLWLLQVHKQDLAIHFDSIQHVFA